MAERAQVHVNNPGDVLSLLEALGALGGIDRAALRSVSSPRRSRCCGVYVAAG